MQIVTTAVKTCAALLWDRSFINVNGVYHQITTPVQTGASKESTRNSKGKVCFQNIYIYLCLFCRLTFFSLRVYTGHHAPFHIFQTIKNIIQGGIQGRIIPFKRKLLTTSLWTVFISCCFQKVSRSSEVVNYVRGMTVKMTEITTPIVLKKYN